MFGLRVDLDSAYGTARGLPNLLEILSNHGANASIFVPMGGETGLIELLKTSSLFSNKAKNKSGEYDSAQTGNSTTPLPAGYSLPLAEKVRIALAPKNYAEENANLLALAQSKGCLIGCHGWKHREWTRSLPTLDVAETFDKMEKKYAQLFGRTPTAFAAPGFKWDLRALAQLDKRAYACAGDLAGETPFRPIIGETTFKCVQAPVNIRAADSKPIIESLAIQGASDEKIVQTACDSIAQKMGRHGYACMYAHDYFECTVKPKVLEQIVAFVEKQGYGFATIEQAAQGCRNFVNVKAPLQ